MIFFKSKEIPGWHTQLSGAPPALTAVRKTYMGLDGELVVIGGHGGREIVCRHWLTKREWTGANPSKIVAELRRLEKLVGEHGKLEERYQIRPFVNPGVPQKFDDCVFLGFTPNPMPGQNSAGAIRDVAGTLHTYANFAQSGGAWFMTGTLRWFQPQV